MFGLDSMLPTKNVKLDLTWHKYASWLFYFSATVITVYLQEYLRTEPSQRNIDSTLIFLLHQRKEPESFTNVFPSWNKDMWKV